MNLFRSTSLFSLLYFFKLIRSFLSLFSYQFGNFFLLSPKRKSRGTAQSIGKRKNRTGANKNE